MMTGLFNKKRVKGRGLLRAAEMPFALANV